MANTSKSKIDSLFFMDNHSESIKVGELFSNPYFERTPLKENLCSTLPSDKCPAAYH